MSLLGARDLGRRSPPAAWEAFFLIGIFPANQALRWCKVQLFSGGRNPRRHCLSSVEGIDGDPSITSLLGYADHIEQHVQPLGSGDLQVADEGWDIRAPGVRWNGDWPSLALRLDAPQLVANTTSQDIVRWIEVDRVLMYWTALGQLRSTLGDRTAQGLGLVEHAYGAATRLDLSRVPWPWHWDVLAFDDGSFAAVLTISAFGGLRGVRGGGRIGSKPLHRISGARIRIDTWDHHEGRAIPAHWRGSLRFGSSVLRYEARASTPIAPAVPDGGFLGFVFDAEWQIKGEASRPLSGTGFCEYRAMESKA